MQTAVDRTLLKVGLHLCAEHLFITSPMVKRFMHDWKYATRQALCIHWMLLNCRCANAEFARVFSWLVAVKYTVRSAGDACAPAHPKGGLHPLGNLVHISAGSASSDEVSGCVKQARPGLSVPFTVCMAGLLVHCLRKDHFLTAGIAGAHKCNKI